MNSADPPFFRDGHTVWLTGRPGAGKTTIARGIAAHLLVEGHRVQVLDIDEMRRNVTGDRGGNHADRVENVRRIAFVALMLAAQGVVAVVPVTIPDEASRRAVRRRHSEHGVGFVEVHVLAPRGVRDAARPVAPADLHGPPAEPDLLVHLRQHSTQESVEMVLDFLRPRLAG